MQKKQVLETNVRTKQKQRTTLTDVRLLEELCADRGNIAGVFGFSNGAKLRTGLKLTSSLPVIGFAAIIGPGFAGIIIIGGIIGE